MGRLSLARRFHCNPRAVEMDRVGWATSMFHSNTERLIDYWRERKVDRLSPLRSAVDPSDFTELLGQVFILGRAAAGQYLFRLAGGLVTELHARDMRQADFLSVWAPTERPRLAAAMEAARRLAEPLVALTEARTANGVPAGRIEVLLAPLRAESGPPDRVLGLYQPVTPLGLGQDQEIAELGLIRFLSGEQRESFPRLKLAAVDGRLIA